MQAKTRVRVRADEGLSDIEPSVVKSTSESGQEPARLVRDGREKSRRAKGIQARAKIKRAAMQVLERQGYHAMRITDVTAEAGVATGLFYHYFKDLRSLTLEVLTDFVAESRNVARIEKDVAAGDWYGRIVAHNTLVVNSYAEHPGIIRCLLQMADEDKTFSALLRNSFIETLNWLVKQMPRLFPKAQFNEHQALLMVYALAGSGETLLRDYFINEEPALHAEAVSKEQLIELLSLVFYRGLFLQNPPQEKLKHNRFIGDM